MTQSHRPSAESVIALADVDQRNPRLEMGFAFFNRALLAVLALATLALTLFAISPAALANTVAAHNGSLMITQRLAFALGAVLTGGAAIGLNKRLTATWFWSRLPTDGTLIIGRNGIRVRHNAVLDGEVNIAWSNVRAVALDSGTHHDKALTWRRFPLPTAGHERSYLFATDGEPRPEFALIAGRPVAPNIAILLHQPIALHNPNAALTAVTFPTQANTGVPAHPPAGHTSAAGLFLRTKNLNKTRRALLPSGKLRALRVDDVN